MRTTVVNVRVKHIRPRHGDLRSWMQDPDNVYIGRKRIVFIDGARFPEEDSLWANPFKGEGAIEKFEAYIRDRIHQENLLPQLAALKGKNLGCWCKPERCHGDVLLKLITELEL